MKPRDHKIMEERKRNLEGRLDRENLSGDLDKPVLGDLNVHYEMSGRARSGAAGSRRFTRWCRGWGWIAR